MSSMIPPTYESLPGEYEEIPVIKTRSKLSDRALPKPNEQKSEPMRDMLPGQRIEEQLSRQQMESVVITESLNSEKPLEGEYELPWQPVEEQLSGQPVEEQLPRQPVRVVPETTSEYETIEQQVTGREGVATREQGPPVVGGYDYTRNQAYITVPSGRTT